MVQESAARERARRRRLQSRRGGEWAWVIVAFAMLGVVITIGMSVSLLLRASQESSEIIPTAAAVLPTPVDARTSFTNADGMTGQEVILNDGRSFVLTPWNGTSRFTVLVMGLDRRTGETGLAYRTDTMMLVSIDPATIPQLSYVDVLQGRFDPAAVAGRSVLIGPVAIELGDWRSVPRYRALPGPLVQALAFAREVGQRLRQLGRGALLLGDVLADLHEADQPALLVQCLENPALLTIAYDHRGRLPDPLGMKKPAPPDFAKALASPELKVAVPGIGQGRERRLGRNRETERRERGRRKAHARRRAGKVQAEA